MSCAAPATFRALDDRVGWDARPGDGLTGVVVDDGALTLAPLTDPLPADVITPPRLAWMCETCTWWLAGDDGLLKLGPCDTSFVPWPAPPIGRRVLAVAARGRRVAAVVEGEGVRVYHAPTRRQVGEVPLPHATAVSLTPWNTLLVGDAHGALHEHEPSGLPLRSGPFRFTPTTKRKGSDAAARWLAHPVDGACRTVVVHADGTITVVTGDHAEAAGREALDGLAPTRVTRATEAGYCLEDRGCFAWDGTPLDPRDLGPGDARFAIEGTFVSEPLDSGIPGCRWHRVRLETELPAGAALELAVATTDAAEPAAEPHQDDWVAAPAGATDVTLRTPPGRFAYVRLRLTGDGLVTPVVHQVRLDLPRRTSLDELPAAYAEDHDARDFGERFLSLFDAQLEELDEVLDRRHALLDADALPDDAFGWLGGLLGLGFEAEMTVAQRRALIAEAPDLYRRRGTPSGLVDTLRIALGITATVEELGPARPWGATGSARLGAVRLFGRSRARVRLGTSALGTAPLIARGNPDADARLCGANRIVVTVPARTPRELVERVVRSQTPAHVVASVRITRPGFVLTELRLGIDTVLLAPEPAVVGGLRLGRGGVLARGRTPCPAAIAGQPLLALPSTRLE